MKRGLDYPDYKRLVRCVFKRDEWKCRHCKSRNDLHAHHVVYRSHGGPDTTGNLLTLCVACHRKVHEGERKRRLSMSGDADGEMQFVWLYY